MVGGMVGVLFIAEAGNRVRAAQERPAHAAGDAVVVRRVIQGHEALAGSGHGYTLPDRGWVQNGKCGRTPIRDLLSGGCPICWLKPEKDRGRLGPTR